MRPNPVKEFLFWFFVTLGAVGVLGVLYDIAYGAPHAGDVCAPPERCYVQCGDVTVVNLVEQVTACCYHPDTRECIVSKDPACEIKCGNGCGVTLYQFPALGVDYDGDGDVDLIDYAIVQILAKRSCP